MPRPLPRAGELGGLAAALLAGLASANQYDVFFPRYLPPAECASGCARWADVAADGVTGIDQSEVNALFAGGAVPEEAGSSCLWPGAAPVHGENRRLLTSSADSDSWLWSQTAANRPKGAENGSVPYCYCRGGKGAFSAHCTPPVGVPEQINLQFAAADIVVAAFVTFEKSPPADPPSAMFGEQGATPVQLEGISHWYVLPGDPTATSPNLSRRTRNYTMSFVKFAGLKPGTRYTYKVKSGSGADAQWSDEFTFRSLRDKSEGTRIGTYGDMGVSPYNNMQNLLTDCASGTIDVFMHMCVCCLSSPAVRCVSFASASTPQGRSLLQLRYGGRDQRRRVHECHAAAHGDVPLDPCDREVRHMSPRPR